jgi:hypothetical protein
MDLALIGLKGKSQWAWLQIYVIQILASLYHSQTVGHFLQRSANAEQLVFAENDQAFIITIVG